MHFRPWKRRKFMTLLGGAAAWPLAARAQQPTIPLIGFIRNTTRDDSADLLKAMHQGLRQTGYVEGRNVAVEYRFADNQLDRLPTMAADLVRRQVAIHRLRAATADHQQHGQRPICIKLRSHGVRLEHTLCHM